MSSETRQRRGKKAESNASSGGDQPLSIDDQILRSEITLMANRERTEQLYQQWRTHLKRLSYLVVIMAFHQALKPTTGCINDIKAVNERVAAINGMRAFAMVIHESLCELVGIVLTSLLAAFLSLDPPGDFSSTPYMISAMLVPFQIGLFYQTRIIGCAGEFDVIEVDLENRERSFPVSILFHSIVTAAYWFMQFGLNKADENIQQLHALKRDLKNARNERMKK